MSIRGDGRLPTQVTVVVPVRNMQSFIGRQLAALAEQECPVGWDVLLVDNGSTDGTVAIAGVFADVLPGFRVVHEPRPGIGPARNAALTHATGELLAFCDADDIVQPGWLAALVIASETADLVGGYCDASLSSSARAISWRGLLPPERLPVALDRLEFAPGGNCAVWRDVALEAGGWDETFVAGADDVDFSWRLRKAGKRVGFAPEAVIAYTYREGFVALIQQFFRYGSTEVLLYKRHRTTREEPGKTLLLLLRKWWWLARATRMLVRSPTDRGIWLKELAYRSGRLAGSFKYRILLP